LPCDDACGLEAEKRHLPGALKSLTARICRSGGKKAAICRRVTSLKSHAFPPKKGAEKASGKKMQLCGKKLPDGNKGGSR
jgi:hypothetical protein